jgi:archaellum component FlaC
MSDNLGTFIVMSIQTVVFLAPVLLLFYKQGRKDQVLDEVVRDVDGMGRKVAEIRDHQSQMLSELKSQIESFNSTLIRVTTLVEIITKDIDELKKNNRGKL